MRNSSRILSLFTALILCVLLCPAISLAASAPSYLTCAIVATDDLELRPLELNQRDVVSVLDLVYEGLFTMDDNYMPQPELAYSYEFISDGRRLRVTLRDDVTFHNGQKLTAKDVVATLDYMFEISGFDKDVKKIVCAYHAGQGNVDAWLRNPAYSSDGVTLDVIPTQDTAAYASRVLRAVDVYRKYYFPAPTPMPVNP